jgi:hypothetical protein
MTAREFQQLKLLFARGLSPQLIAVMGFLEFLALVILAGLIFAPVVTFTLLLFLAVFIWHSIF